MKENVLFLSPQEKNQKNRQAPGAWPEERRFSDIEHIIRDREDYETRIKYIYENPIRRYYDELHAEE